jgi:hypothetical protein
LFAPICVNNRRRKLVPPPPSVLNRKGVPNEDVIADVLLVGHWHADDDPLCQPTGDNAVFLARIDKQDCPSAGRGCRDLGAANREFRRHAASLLYLRDARANYNDIIWWPTGGGWKNQSLTVNTSVRYLYLFSNTKTDGPVVLELPAGVNGAGFFGTITDAWFVPLVDIGGAGEDKGKGGKYLILPPDYKGQVPSGYFAVRPTTYNSYTLLRSILKSEAEADVNAGNRLVKQIRAYPLSKAASPPEQRFVDMTDILYQGLAQYDENFYVSLAHILNEEPVHPRDLEMMGMLLPLGIQKGKDFNPDAAMKAELRSAAQEAHAWLVEGLVQYSTDHIFGRTLSGFFPHPQSRRRRYLSGQSLISSMWTHAESLWAVILGQLPPWAKGASMRAATWTPAVNHSQVRIRIAYMSLRMPQ